MRVSLDTGSLEAASTRLLSALDTELEDCLERAAEKGAARARSEHAFQNRTGDLEGSIEATPPIGRFSADTLQASVTAGMEYASFVERSRPFLEPVAAELDADLGAMGADAIERAVQKAGW